MRDLVTAIRIGKKYFRLDNGIDADYVSMSDEDSLALFRQTERGMITLYSPDSSPEFEGLAIRIVDRQESPPVGRDGFTPAQ